MTLNKTTTGTGDDTQSSAYAQMSTATTEDRITYLFEEAIRHYDVAEQEERRWLELGRSSLINARRAGEYLNKAKAEVEKAKQLWLPVLREKFGKERNGQNCMEIARRWDELQPALAKNPNLSINGALRVLRGKERKPEEDEDLKKRRQIFHEVQRILQHVWPVWSSKDIAILSDKLAYGWDAELDGWMKGVMRKLRYKVWREKRNIHNRERFTPLLPDAFFMVKGWPYGNKEE
jgi:hypothetical protein